LGNVYQREAYLLSVKVKDSGLFKELSFSGNQIPAEKGSEIMQDFPVVRNLTLTDSNDRYVVLQEVCRSDQLTETVEGRENEHQEVGDIMEEIFEF
jgi:hypothetical protein